MTWPLWPTSGWSILRTGVEAGGGGAESRVRGTHSHQPLRWCARAASRAVTLTRRHPRRHRYSATQPVLCGSKPTKRTENGQQNSLLTAQQRTRRVANKNAFPKVPCLSITTTQKRVSCVSSFFACTRQIVFFEMANCSIQSWNENDAGLELTQGAQHDITSAWNTVALLLLVHLPGILGRAVPSATTRRLHLMEECACYARLQTVLQTESLRKTSRRDNLYYCTE